LDQLVYNMSINLHSSLLPRKAILAIAAVIDVALHARPTPVAAKALAQRHNLPPRHLETLLQDLVHAQILKGVRGPKGGYELSRERRRISLADIVRAALFTSSQPSVGQPEKSTLEAVILPHLESASLDFLSALDKISVEDVCQSISQTKDGPTIVSDFTI